MTVASDAVVKSRRAVGIGSCVVVLVLICASGWAHRWTADDGFIYMRVVRNVVHGHGPVFNPGQRVEAFTSPLWLATLATADLATPLRLEWIAAILGIGLSVLGTAFAMIGSSKLVRAESQDAMLLPLGAVTFAAVAATWYWQSSGLETGLVLAWIGLSCLLLASWARSESQLRFGSAVALGAGWLVRPEFVVVSAIFLAVVVIAQWSRDRWTHRARTLLAAFALPVLYEIFRMGYYGLLVANTAIAKEGTRTRYTQGWWYLVDFWRPYWLWLPVALLIIGVYAPLVIGLQRAQQTRAALVVCAFLMSAFVSVLSVVAYGGDYLHGRLLVAPLFLLCAPVAVVPVATRYVLAGVIAIWAVICATALRPPELRHASGLGPHLFSLHHTNHVTVDAVGWNDRTVAQWYRGPALYIQAHAFTTGLVPLRIQPSDTTPLPTAVLQGIGAPGYKLNDFDVIDVHGLADPLAAHFRLARRGFPGHEKTLTAPWLAAVLTAPNDHPRALDIQIPNDASTPYASDVPFDQEVEVARRALGCSQLRDLVTSTERPLTVGRFFGNILHSVARTTFRIPSDPRDAAEAFCPSASRGGNSAARVAPVIVSGAPRLSQHTGTARNAEPQSP